MGGRWEWWASKWIIHHVSFSWILVKSTMRISVLVIQKRFKPVLINVIPHSTIYIKQTFTIILSILCFIQSKSLKSYFHPVCGTIKVCIFDLLLMFSVFLYSLAVASFNLLMDRAFKIVLLCSLWDLLSCHWRNLLNHFGILFLTDFSKYSVSSCFRWADKGHVSLLVRISASKLSIF